jgi:hypothetical protein
VSEINKDKDVLENGRRAPLKDVDAPLRDQVVDKLFSKLEEMEIGEKVVTLWNKGSYNRQRWLERQKAYLASWDEHLISSTDGAFEGSSQLHIPMPFIVCKTLHARFLQALWQDPPFNLKARNEASIDRLATVSDTLRYALMDWANHDKGAEAEVDRWVWRWITNGSGILKMGWDTKYERFIDVTEVPAPGKPKLKIVDGKEKVIPTIKMVEKEIAVTKKCFDGPTVRGVQVEDLLIVGGDGDPDKAEAVIEQDWLTASDLWTLADRKIFKSDKVEKVIESGPQKKSGSLSAELKVQRNQNAGHSSLDFETDHDRYHILEAYLQVDVDGSGINSNVVVWVHAKTKEILRATYLRRVSPKGERPYAKADFILRDGQEYGAGMPEVLYPLSQEMDAMHNMRIDWGMISVMPFGFYRSSSGLDPETIRFEPGALIPVDNPQRDVYFPNIGNRTVFGMQEEAAIQNIVERLTSISDLNLGVMNGQGAARTATGARALVGEMGSNLDVYLRRLNRGWKKCLRYTLHLLQKRCPPGLSFRLTGEDGQDYWRYVRALDDIQGDYDIEVSANSSTSNPGIQADNAQQIMQMVNNPLAIQMGVVNPGGYFEAYKNQCIALGIKDYGKFFQKPQGYERNLTPEEEANRLLRGIEVQVVPGMDHQGFIEFFQHIHDTDELAGQFSQEQFIALAAQAKKHQQMAEAMQAAQSQQANASQMQRNAQMSQQQAPMGGAAPAPQMNPMAQAGGAA